MTGKKERKQTSRTKEASKPRPVRERNPKVSSSITADNAGQFRNEEKFKPRTINQKNYLNAIETSDITFAIGPSGCGKTLLAIKAALDHLNDGKVKKIVLTRPAVEAEEHIGFLPGDIMEKMDPYLRSMYDSLTEFITKSEVESRLKNGTIEIVPLGLMRGRSLNNCIIVADECQNTTIRQIKMLLTRIGRYSKAVITGDHTQIDLEFEHTSGLMKSIDILKNVTGISIIQLDKIDIQRNKIVEKVLTAFEENGL